MSLVVRPVKHADVSHCIALRVASLGSLVIGHPPPYPGYVEEAETTVHIDLDNSTHVHHLKVVDEEDEEIVIAYAKWEIYPHGRPDLDNLRKPMDRSDKEVDQYGLLRAAAHEYFCGSNASEAYTIKRIVLALLVTSVHYRQRGAGSLLVKWGIEKSRETGLPPYLQASEQGRRLYLHHGFEDIGTVQFNLSDYGLDGVVRMTEMIRKRSTSAVSGILYEVMPNATNN